MEEEPYTVTLQMNVIYPIRAKSEGEAVNKAKKMLMQTGDYMTELTYILARLPKEARDAIREQQRLDPQ